MRVDGDEKLYPPGRLWQWKTEHEGANGKVLAPLQFSDPEQAIALLVAGSGQVGLFFVQVAVADRAL
ncbi:hypothetical protein [Actinoplanes regularis]|uniref:Uncharacterized protein n=1 Tax=Actinoplanes regularis TaxID=52697 RepID=A0A239KB92_9ACTN|nr:hypothetical protein [Actinoplanes regularis]GIE92472.1 hypothetical protein Are01nite_89520 [Actinoplanes regularis]SNT14972.1 hypothetical protein SAMN06264365_1469 [Actinoplanes regularis]